MKKNKKLSNKQMIVTVLFGYGLFILTVIGTIASVAITVTRTLSDPTVQHERMIILFVSMALATILPPLISYIVGHRAARANSVLERRYNGVLFGIASVWLSLILSFSYPFLPESSFMLIQLRQFWPAIVAILVMLALGVIYAKLSKPQVALLRFRPYQAFLLLLIVGVMLANIWYLVSYIAVHLGSLHFGSSEMITGMTVAIQLAMLAISYHFSQLKKSAWLDRLSDASILASIGIIATMVIGQLVIMYTSMNTLAAVLLMNVVGVCVWLVYLRLIYVKRY